MSKTEKYYPFNTFILRTPAFVFEEKKIKISDNDYPEMIQKLLSDTYFSEALFLASPSLFRLASSVSKNKFSETEIENIYLSLLKYRLRMMTRSTPFGLFAGISTGTIAKENRLEQTQRKIIRHTRLDMNYLIALAQELSLQPEIQEKLIYFPNSSLYKLGHQWRYIEYYYEKSKRIHESVSIESGEYIDFIIREAGNGISFSELVQKLTDDEISTGEATDFVRQLIQNQILVSELEPSVSGDEFMYQILSVLKKIPEAQKEYDLLVQIERLLQKLDMQSGHSPEIYRKIKDLLSKLPASFDENYLFQTDLAIQTKKLSLAENLVRRIKETVDFLQKIHIDKTNPDLEQFGKKLYERFENQAVPLALALDPELGLSIHSTAQTTGIHPLINEVETKNQEDESVEQINWHPVNRILYDKLVSAGTKQQAIIHLSAKDFKDTDINNKSIPETFSTMFHLVRINGTDIPVITNTGGSSAGNLAARFAYIDDNILKYIRQIAQKENEMFPEKILAEIVHLPESRVGNILMRPKIREYEIPYLARSTQPADYQIKVTDLWIQANASGQLKLFSKKHRKEIVPRLTNAHNYRSNALPVYYFLSLFQQQNKINHWHFSWGDLEKLFDFFPRVMYNNTIISPAKWKIKANEVIFLKTAGKKELMSFVKQWQQEKNIPGKILLTEGDNKLYINLNNYHHVKMFARSIRNKKEFYLEEFLFEQGSAVNDKNKFYTNEIIIGFYKDK